MNKTNQSVGFGNLVKMAKSIQAGSLNGVTPDQCGDWADIAEEGYRLAREGKYEAALAALCTTPGLMEHLAAPESETEPSLWQHFTLDSGLEHYRTEKPWLIYGLYQQDSLGMIYGDGGSGKTYLAINQAVHLACGIPWLSNEYPASGEKKVLYCISEGRRQFFFRMLAAVNGMGQMGYDVTEIKRKVNQNILIVTEVPQLFTDNARLSVDSYLEFWEAENRPHIDLVIIDTLHRAAVGSNENSEQDANLILEQCRRLSRELGCAVQLIHHSNKSGGYRGSTAYRNDIDVAIKIEGRGREPRTVIIDKERDCPPDGPIADTRFVQKFYIDEVTQASFVTVEPEVGTKVSGDNKMLQLKAKIEDVLMEHSENGLSTNQVCKMVTGKKEAITNALKEMLADGRVRVEPKGSQTLVYFPIGTQVKIGIDSGEPVPDQKSA
jgi:archaellum biogenesis ATPase FlaH